MAAAFITLAVISNYMLIYEAQGDLEYVMAVAIGLAAVLGTAWCYANALRRRMIRLPIMLAAAATWTAAVVVMVKQWPTIAGQPMLPTYAVSAGALAIAVAPFAAAPLAIAWHR